MEQYVKDACILEDTNELEITTLSDDVGSCTTDTDSLKNESEDKPRVKLFACGDTSQKLDQVDKTRYGLQEKIKVLENKLNTLTDSSQRAVMQKIISSAYEGKSELPKVMDIVGEVMSDGTEHTKAQLKKSMDVQSVDITKPFVRRQVDYTALDEMYRQESLAFIERYRKECTPDLCYPEVINENDVQDILNKPVHVDTGSKVICHVENYDTHADVTLPGDKVLEDLNKNIMEDPLFSYDSMHYYDSELGDFVCSYEEENLYTTEDILSV